MKKEKYLLEVAESIGDFMSYWGFKSIHGKVWALIYLSQEPISTPEIVSFLGVSKGLVSRAIGELLEHKLIVPGEKIIYGAQTYRSSNEVGKTVREILKARELEKIKQSEEALKKLHSFSKAELQQCNISTAKTKDLLELTTAHKNLLNSILVKRFESMKDWIRYIKRAGRYLRF